MALGGSGSFDRGEDPLPHWCRRGSTVSKLCTGAVTGNGLGIGHDISYLSIW